MPPSPAAQLTSFIAKFTPAMAKQIRACRSAMRKILPTANELIYDNYNFFVIGFGPTERPYDCILSLASNSKGVGLCFLYGAKLPDPHKLLQGSGNQTRFVRLDGAASLRKPAIRALIMAAKSRSRAPFPKSGGHKLIIRSISPKQRPRR